MKQKGNKQEQIIKKAASLGITLKVNKDLDKLSDKVLFPEILEWANKILSNTKFRYVK